MTERKLAPPSEVAETDGHALRRGHGVSTSVGEWKARHGRTPEEVEARYLAAREAWTTAMRAAQSGRPADLAALAVAQDEYEAALTEKQRWDSAPRVAMPIEPDRPTAIDAIVGQELIRRQVHELEEQHRRVKPTGLLGRLRRVRGR